MKFVEEFKKFAFKGNVVDMAIGVIVGGAFTSIVNSLVNDIFTPIVGVISGGYDFSGLTVKVGEAEVLIGNFINAIISFLLVALCLFLFIKFINKFKAKEEAKPAATPKDIELLTEIRDLLKEKTN